MFDVITIGGATRDVFFTTSCGKVFDVPNHKTTKKYLGFEYGAKIIPENTEFSHGGGGVNTAVSFSKLGLKTATIIRIGADGTGSLVVKDLVDAGVNPEFITKDRSHHTALSIIVTVPGRDHTMFLHRGSNDYLEVRDWRPIKTKWFYLSSLTGDSVEMIPEVFSYSRAHNVKVAWNPGSEQLNGGYEELSSYLEMTDILILNREEAIALVLSKNNRTKVSDEKVLLKSLSEMTNGIIVMTDAENGCYITDGEKDYYHTAITKVPVETTGAGDAFGSTFVATYMLGYGIKGAMRFASINAANVVKYFGAQKGLMTIEELRGTIEIGGKDEKIQRV